MSGCYELVNGSLYPLAESLEQCSGVVLLDKVDYALLHSQSMLFSMPSQSQLSELFLWSMGTVVFCWLIASSYSVVVNFINK